MLFARPMPVDLQKLIINSLAVFLGMVVFATSAFAERLPIKTYTSADGLGSGFVDFIYKDSRGFMWFCTRDGLSRFDGTSFVTYKLGDATSPPGIENIYETSDGIYWVVTTGGAFRFDPNATTPTEGDTTQLNAQLVTGSRGLLLQARDGTLYMGSAGLLKLVEKDGKPAFETVSLGLPPRPEATFVIFDLAQTPDDSLWFHSSWGLIRMLPDGRIVYYPYEKIVTGGSTTMNADSSGKIWIARGSELLVFRPKPIAAYSSGQQLIEEALPTTSVADITPGSDIPVPKEGGEMIEYRVLNAGNKWAPKKIFQTSDGDMWISAENTLMQFRNGSFQIHTDLAGFPNVMARMGEDAAGNLWIGGQSGLARLDRSGMTTFGKQDGLDSSRFYSINEASDGRLFFGQRGYFWTSYDGKSFKTARPALPDLASPLWTSRIGFLSSTSELWLTSNLGLYRFADGNDVSSLSQKTPSETYGTKTGLKTDAAFQIFEDSTGDVWVSTRGSSPAGHGLARMRKGETEFKHFGDAEGLPEAKSAASYIEDKNGRIWVSHYEGGVSRFDGDKFQNFSKDNGLPENGHISDMHIDRKGQLWLASSVQGLYRLSDMTAAQPVFEQVKIETSSVSSNIRTLTEDRFGRLYLGTARGVDRYSPDTGYVKHYSVSDGLASDFVVDSHCDKNGDIWFATNDGLSRLTPMPDEKVSPPRVMIGGLRIDGSPQLVPKLGTANIEKGELDHTANNLQIDYLGLDFRASESLKYQYKLEGADADWSVPNESRTVTFANLKPASYRFLVRAVNSEGQISEAPATLSFTIIPPLWQRPWFIILSAIVIALIVAAIFRYRTARLREVNEALREAKIAEEKLRRSREDRIVELEQVRARIATDLHDDIGASLTQIAILSEVAQTQGNGSNGAREPLEKITEVSNDLVDTMSDIVWSINPAKDHLSDLIQRMRRFASDVFSTKNIRLRFLAPGEGGETVVTSNIRREVFLIFKETVNNVLKHAEATGVRIEIAIENNELIYRITDDGVGFDPNNPSPSRGGHGVTGMRGRVEELGGKLQIISEPGKGTTVSLTLPISDPVIV